MKLLFLPKQPHAGVSFDSEGYYAVIFSRKGKKLKSSKNRYNDIDKAREDAKLLAQQNGVTCDYE